MRLGHAGRENEEGNFSFILPACWLVLACSPTAIAPPPHPSLVCKTIAVRLGRCALDGAV